MHVTNYLEAADTRSSLDAVRALGARVEERGADGLVVHGAGLRGATPGAAIDVGNAGTLLRLLPGWLAGQPEGGRWTLDGDESIRRRPVDRVATPLAAMGAQLEARDGRYTPLVDLRPRRCAAPSTCCRSPPRRSRAACCWPACSPRGRRPWSSPSPAAITPSACWRGPARA